MLDYVRALQRRIGALEAQVKSLRTERDIARIDRQYAVTELAHAYELQNGLVDVPTELEHALRSVSPHRLQGVRLTADGHDLHVLVDGAAYQADPGVEVRVWDWLTEHAGAPPSHALARLEMPERLYAVAWSGGQIAVSLTLSGPDVVAAHRALRRPRQCGLLRALSVLAIPGSGAGRAVLSVLRDAQAATAAATSTATTAAATVAGTALPAVTAAAISCTAVTSCAPTVSAAVTRPPAKVQVLDHSAPLAVDPAEPKPYKVPRRKASPAPEDAAGEQVPKVVLTEPVEHPKPDAQRKAPPGPVEESPSAPPSSEPPPDNPEPESEPVDEPVDEPVVVETDTPGEQPPVTGGEPAPTTPVPTTPTESEDPAPVDPARGEQAPSEDAPPRDGDPADDGSPLETPQAPAASPVVSPAL